MEDDMNIAGEPALSGEAGLTFASAKAAGDHGHADDELHAGFITKQTPLPAATPGPPQGGHADAGVSRDAMEGLVLERAELREPALSAEAGATDQAARVTGGFVDEKLHAGFISKQTGCQ